MMEDLYFVAFFKHDQPQHLMAGPFMDETDARTSSTYTSDPSRRCVVKTTLLFEKVDE